MGLGLLLITSHCDSSPTTNPTPTLPHLTTLTQYHTHTTPHHTSPHNSTPHNKPHLPSWPLFAPPTQPPAQPPNNNITNNTPSPAQTFEQVANGLWPPSLGPFQAMRGQQGESPQARTATMQEQRQMLKGVGMCVVGEGGAVRLEGGACGGGESAAEWV